MSTNYAFQPDAVEALATAFRKSWSFISVDPCFVRQDPILLQRLLSKCLMRLAADGEHDPLRLANAAIYQMRHESRARHRKNPSRTPTDQKCYPCLRNKP
jgi:hypothetical protein